MRPDRQHFVRLDPASEHFLQHFPNCHGDGRKRVWSWVDAGRPLVVASAAAEDPADSVRLGLATPEKFRFTILVPVAAITAIEPAPMLCAAVQAAPRQWHELIETIVSVTGRHGLDCRVFGSVAWQFLSGESFVRVDSDIDLLLRPTSKADILAALDAIFELPEAARIDGELVLGDGSGVNLRELRSRPVDVLVKRHGGPRLVGFNQIMELVGAQQ